METQQLKLIVDYNADDGFQMLGFMQVWAHRTGSDIPTGDSRSLASSKHSSRRMCSLGLDVDSGYSMDALTEMMHLICPGFTASAAGGAEFLTASTARSLFLEDMVISEDIMGRCWK